MLKNSTKYYSSRQESYIAGFLGWETVVGSGARNFFPGDIICDDWLGECKTHTSPGHKLTFDFEVWDKIDKEAVSQNRKPVLFCDDGSQHIDKTWCLVSSPLFKDITTEESLDKLSKQKTINLRISQLEDLLEESEYLFIPFKHIVNDKCKYFGLFKLEDFQLFESRL